MAIAIRYHNSTWFLILSWICLSLPLAVQSLSFPEPPFDFLFSWASQDPLQDITGISSTTSYTLPDLPYSYDALEPVISRQIMELHHSKHHQTYVNNLNSATAALMTAVATNNVSMQVALQPALRFNGGGHINHSLFWRNLAPSSSSEALTSSAPKLAAAIEATWGSMHSFQETFNTALLGIQGSGWGWLVKFEGENGRLGIVTTKDQDPIVAKGEVPIVGIDMWEHAYYLQYLNGKAAYVKNMWQIINWKTAEARYLGGE